MKRENEEAGESGKMGDRKKEQKMWHGGGGRLATVSPTFDLLHDSFRGVIVVILV